MEPRTSAKDALERATESSSTVSKYVGLVVEVCDRFDCFYVLSEIECKFVGSKGRGRQRWMLANGEGMK